MKCVVITKRDVIKGVPESWRAQYGGQGYKGTYKEAILLKLLLCGVETCDASVVDKIIGNNSWTKNECDQCEKDCDVILRIGEEPDYDGRWQDLCPDCLREASEILAKALQK